MGRPAPRTVLTIVMDVLVVFAVLVTAGIVTSFFGALESTVAGDRLSDVAAALTPALGLPEWSTPYGGVFRGDSAALAVGVLGAEWVLSVARRRVG